MVNDTLRVEFKDLFSDFAALFLNNSNYGGLNVWNEIEIDVTELAMYSSLFSSNTYDVVEISMSCWRSVRCSSFIGILLVFSNFCWFKL